MPRAAAKKSSVKAVAKPSAKPLKRGNTALAEAHERDSTTTKRPRTRTDVNITAQAKHALRDHCKGWSHNDIYVKVVEGYRLNINTLRLASDLCTLTAACVDEHVFAVSQGST
eukprot:6492338-Amphidinium_carterae.3